MNVKTQQLFTVLTELKNMLIRRTIFIATCFRGLYFLSECEIPNFADVGRRTRTASLHE